MDPSLPPPQKKGLGVLAWLGIGCGGLIVVVVILLGVGAWKLGPSLKEFGTNPTKAAAKTAVTVSGGKLEIVAEDDVNKRYTLREKTSGKMTTIYWDAKKQVPVNVEGDFSAVPADANPPATPDASTPKQ